ncbi:hypothetical protein [Psychrobacter sp. AOP1-A1-60]|uniref:hypothetical protein n=1 Tax=Psychrobacter sp. AOP1-A1-60 TaxID=3457727 RepID=UPI0040373210
MKVKAKEIFEKITSVRALLFYILLSIWSLIDIVSGTVAVNVRHMPTVDIDTSYGTSIPVEIRDTYGRIPVEVTNSELDVEVTNSWYNAVPVDPQ